MSAPDFKPAGNQDTKSVWVVFSGKADCLWLKCLKPGFRHCFALINDGQRWLSFDPMLHYTDLQMHHHIPPAFDLPAWFAARGYTVLKAPDGVKPQKPAPLSLFSCVECVKRLLGLHRRFIVTPWQLYRHLSGQQAR